MRSARDQNDCTRGLTEKIIKIAEDIKNIAERINSDKENISDLKTEIKNAIIRYIENGLELKREDRRDNNESMTGPSTNLKDASIQQVRSKDGVGM